MSSSRMLTWVTLRRNILPSLQKSAFAWQSRSWCCLRRTSEYLPTTRSSRCFLLLFQSLNLICQSLWLRIVYVHAVQKHVRNDRHERQTFVRKVWRRTSWTAADSEKKIAWNWHLCWMGARYFSNSDCKRAVFGLVDKALVVLPWQPFSLVLMHVSKEEIWRLNLTEKGIRAEEAHFWLECVGRWWAVKLTWLHLNWLVTTREMKGAD